MVKNITKCYVNKYYENWRACNKILPKLTSLFRKGVVSNYSCYFCGGSPETEDHVFWTCPYAEKAWSSILAF